jgi:hypothetical protein
LIKCKKSGARDNYGALLGLWVGLGWYFSKFWIFNLPVFGVILFYLSFWNGRRNFRLFFYFLAASFLCLLPMFYFILTGQYGNYIHSRFPQWDPAWRRYQALAFLSYWTSFFWGCLYREYFSFSSLWGGLFNPLLASSFILGFVEFFRTRRNGFFGLGLALLGLYILPASLTLPIEVMRVVPSLPLFLFVMTVGIFKLFSNFHLARKGSMFLSLFLLISLTLDLYNFFGPYHQWAASLDSKPAERFRAYQILAAKEKEAGPGIILADLVPDIVDQSLLITTYPFNAARNPRLSPLQAGWAGILIPAGDRDDLVRRFPGGAYFSLTESLNGIERGLGLFLVGVNSVNQKTFLTWIKANQFFQSTYGLLPIHLPTPSYVRITQEFSAHFDLFRDDPYLQCCYWTKMADYLSYGNDADAFFHAASNVVKCGHASSVLYVELAHWFYKMGDFVNTKKYLEKAKELDPSTIYPPEIWDRLENLIKNSRPPKKG